MRHALIHALRARGIDVLTAMDAGMIERTDEEHLAFATAQGRVLCSFNVADFYRLHSDHMAQQKVHAGIVLAQPPLRSVGWRAWTARHCLPDSGRLTVSPWPSTIHSYGWSRLRLA
jgi:hypothetical protein